MKTLPLLTLLVLAYTAYIRSCNENLCAALVSKCLLIKSCDCDMSNKRNCSCCRDCHVCLSTLYTECCSCVEMCPKSRLSISPNASTVDDLTEAITELFDVLTEKSDPLNRWTVYKYTPIVDSRFMTNEHLPTIIGKLPGKDQKLYTYTNCTVAYMSQCCSLGKCKDACVSMGASKLRWFHEDGCCQCIGQTCPDYGINARKCLECSTPVHNHYVKESDNQNSRQTTTNSAPSKHRSGNSVLVNEIKMNAIKTEG